MIILILIFKRVLKIIFFKSVYNIYIIYKFIIKKNLIIKSIKIFY